MNQDVFDACLRYYNREDVDNTWERLADRYGFKSGEALRSQFKRVRKSLKIGPAPTKKFHPDFPRVVCFDVEVSPLLVWTFRLAVDYISPDDIVEDHILMAWAAKELNDAQVHSGVLTEEEAFDHSDERIVTELWNYLNGAQILIGHNVRDFDIKFINTRFVFYGLKPLSSFQSIDTLVEARKNFRFASNKLSHINRQLGIKQKLENAGMKLWIKCLEGDKQSLMDMVEYCEGDVLAVEETYYRFRPFITGHPNIGLYIEGDKSLCPNCG